LNEKEKLIVKNLLENSEYSKKVSPFVEEKYFDDTNGRIIIKHFVKHLTTYKAIPSYEELFLAITDTSELTEKASASTVEELKSIRESELEKFAHDYLVDVTEHHFQEVALEKCIMTAAEILNSEEKKINKHQLPEMMREALKVSFKNNIGQVYGSEKQIDEQYHYYHHKDRGFPFPEWKTLTDLTRGGFAKKRITVWISGTNVGKTVVMVNCGIQLLKSGSNVLYITAEDGENAILERVDGNMLDTETGMLPTITKETYKNKIESIRKQSNGRFIVKEYPTASSNSNHIRALLDELEIKENFKPDFICLDYLNLFMSTRYKNMGDTYVLVKAVTEEMRGLAIERNIGIITATQLNRQGFGSTDPEMTDIAESFGIAATADFVCSIIENNTLKEEGKYLFKVLKSRYQPIKPSTQKFLMGVNKEKQQLFELADPRLGLAIDNTQANDDKDTNDNISMGYKAQPRELKNKDHWNYDE
jgi:replicative DNA helicase